MKHEWKTLEKRIYLPKTTAEIINIPKFNYYSIKGKGNPNDEFFSEYIKVLYSLSYAIKMASKSTSDPDMYLDYTVYPLEGVWDISDDAKDDFDGKIDKESLVFNLMIRQPDFVTKDYAIETIKKIKKKKPHQLLDKVKFETFEEGNCIQMMHVGSYDDEINSFKQMEELAEENNLKRISKLHREIYISDARKTATEKLKTVLRFQVQ